MTVQTVVFDGVKRTTRTWREVFKGVNLAQVREGFYAQEDGNQWGVMYQLKGTTKIVLGRFGVTDED